MKNEITNSPDMLLRMDDVTNDALEAYARKIYPKPNGTGNRTEAARQILSAVLKIGQDAEVQKRLKDKDLKFGGDVLVFIRSVIHNHLNQQNKADADASPE